MTSSGCVNLLVYLSPDHEFQVQLDSEVLITTSKDDMTATQHQAVQDNDDLTSYFNSSVSAVQAHADRYESSNIVASLTQVWLTGVCRFEQDYARPALKISQAFFDERPIAAVRYCASTTLTFSHFFRVGDRLSLQFFLY